LATLEARFCVGTNLARDRFVTERLDEGACHGVTLHVECRMEQTPPGEMK
jgi:hypothetical protein